MFCLNVATSPNKYTWQIQVLFSTATNLFSGPTLPVLEVALPTFAGKHAIDVQCCCVQVYGAWSGVLFMPCQRSFPCHRMSILTPF